MNQNIFNERGEMSQQNQSGVQKELQTFAETLFQHQLAAFARQINEHTSKELRRCFLDAVHEHTMDSTMTSKPERNSMASAPKFERYASVVHRVNVLENMEHEEEMEEPWGTSSFTPVLSQVVNTHVSSAYMAGGSHGRYYYFAKRLVKSDYFEECVTFAILMNAIYIGVATDYMARHTLREPPLLFKVFESFFLCFFAVEICLRIFVYRLKLFAWNAPDGKPSQNIYWNLLDIFVVIVQAVEVLCRFFGVNTIDTKVTIFRLFRSVRLIRIVRLLKVLRFVRDLRMIIYSITRSFSLFLWSAIALFLMIFMWGILFTELALSETINSASDLPGIERFFSTLPRTCFSLTLAVTGGIDWNELSDALSNNAFGAGLFVVYITFTLLAVMNVIAGVFLEQAMERAKEERELFLMQNARIIFKRADKNGSGMITWEDFHKTLQHQSMHDFFEAIDIDISEAKNVFDLLDLTGDGSISANEFLNGCLRLRGMAKSLDLLVLSREVSGYFETISKTSSAGAPAGWNITVTTDTVADSSQHDLKHLGTTMSSSTTKSHRSIGGIPLVIDTVAADAQDELKHRCSSPKGHRSIGGIPLVLPGAVE